MEALHVIAEISGVLGLFVSLFASFYLVLRVGFRVDELWKCKDSWDETTVDVAILKDRSGETRKYLLHRAEAEARVKHAIRNKARE